jgi:hypothetical protein
LCGDLNLCDQHIQAATRDVAANLLAAAFLYLQHARADFFPLLNR